MLLTTGKVKYPIQRPVLQRRAVTFGQKVEDLLPEMTRHEQILYRGHVLILCPCPAADTVRTRFEITAADMRRQ